MSDTLEVGRRYRNASGEYEIQAIDGMWATVRYEDGTVKRHLTAALKIHWENDQAETEAAAAAARKTAKAPRVRATKTATPFPVDETTPLIARLIREQAAGGEFITRQAILEALLADPDGRGIVETVHKALFYRTEEWIAGSILDQFAKDVERKGSPVYNQFDRQQIDNVWAYKPK